MSTRLFLPLFPLLFTYGPSLAQLDLPVSLELVGTSSSARQVLNLGQPTDSTAAVSLEVARGRTTQTVVATGQSTLTVSLLPPVGSIQPGLELTVIPGVPHDSAPELLVNGSGPYAIVDWQGNPLDSAEMPVARPSRMVFDGIRFVLMNSAGRPCGNGYSIVSNALCIEDSSHEPLNFRDAAAYCNQNGGRLCTMTEWAVGCHRLPPFISSVNSLEWVDSASNSSTQGKLVGIDRITQAIGCDFGDTSEQNNLYRFRCCSDR